MGTFWMHFAQGYDQMIAQFHSTPWPMHVHFGCALGQYFAGFCKSCYSLNPLELHNISIWMLFPHHFKNVLMSPSVIHSLKSWVQEDHPMGMGMMKIITDSAFRFSFWNKTRELVREFLCVPFLSKNSQLLSFCLFHVYVCFHGRFLRHILVSTFSCSI